MFSLDHLRAPLSDGIATVLGDAQNQDRLIDLIPAWISYLGPDRRYRFANKQYRDRFALSEKDIVGMHVRDILGAEAYATAKPQLDEAYRGRRRSFENRIRSALGEERVIRVELIPDFRDGRVNGVVSLVTDITEQKRAEDALKKRARRMGTPLRGTNGGAP